MRSLRRYGAVSLGGFMGAVLRYWLGGLFVIGAGGFPLGTFIINLSGSLALGFLLTWLLEGYPKAAPEWRLFLGTGIIGSYTTFSTFSVEALTLYRGGYWLTGLLYSVLSLGGGLLAVWLGSLAARGLLGKTQPPPKAEIELGLELEESEG